MAVVKATEAYMTAEDAMAPGSTKSVNANQTHGTSSMHLFTSWTAWANAAGEIAGSQKRLTQKLEDRGIHEKGHQ